MCRRKQIYGAMKLGSSRKLREANAYRSRNKENPKHTEAEVKAQRRNKLVINNPAIELNVTDNLEIKRAADNEQVQ